jgi:hypothetical protein
MTRDEILNMPAGRDIDTMIPEVENPARSSLLLSIQQLMAASLMDLLSVPVT